ncbi:MAG: polymerase subunit gamma/tau [Actinomycetota bacterium]|nr:polymerase subunit gamma/tau [Actinomycetota bacterium]
MSQALYRRYRPETFADVIGQAHVTEPLQQALRNDRTNHAYLFSGPRGCGKTTSARILARSLNCEQGPTPTPCGVCQSCQDLARGGAGSLDVIEIDAATHGLVDDARDLRERAFYSPASSRYKVYIIDEAHMLGPGASNALLKVVEEPPPHVKFVFATTEPEKVIGTIRSRVHHYPFRLVPPGELQAYLGRICEQEGVSVDKGVLALVVRAGRGSVRDSLSVLDQLIAGAGEAGVTYPLAISLLGYTDASLLDDTVDAFAAADAAAVFGIVDRVVEAGHDPRRFAEDLLERLRDLIIVEAVPDNAASILAEHPADELERMRQQSAHFGASELSRAADIINTGLTEMRGATAPRLQLELMCARVLLPGADDSERGAGARLDRIERRLSIMGTTASEPAVRATRQPAAPAAAPAPAEAAAPAAAQVPAAAASEPAPAEPAIAAAPPAAATPSPEPATTTPPVAPDAPAPDAPAPAADAAIDLTTVRRMWPDVLEVVKGLRRFTWTLLSHNAQVAALDGDRLTLAMVNAGARDSFGRGGSDEIVREALIRVLGVDWKVDAIVDPSASPGGSAPSAGGPAAGGASSSPTDAGGRAASSGRAAAIDRVAAETATRPAAGAPHGGAPGSSYPAEAEPSPDDEDVDDRDVSHQDLLARELGARVIGDYENS